MAKERFSQDDTLPKYILVAMWLQYLLDSNRTGVQIPAQPLVYSKYKCTKLQFIQELMATC